MALPDDFQRKILDWIGDEGYPLEMQTARLCRSAGFEVTQGAYFTDPESGDAREIDIVAGYREFSEPWGWDFEVMLVVECKSSTGKPWIAFTTGHLSPIFEGRLVVERFASPRGFEALAKVSREPSLHALPIFRLPDRPSTSLVQAFKRSGDAAYGALIGLAKAAIHFADAVPEDGPGNPKRARVAFPVLVVDSPLVECYADQSEELTLHEVTHTTVCWGRPSSHPRLRWPLHFIDVVHIDYFEHYVRERMGAFLSLIAAFHAAYGTTRREWPPN